MCDNSDEDCKEVSSDFLKILDKLPICSLKLDDVKRRFNEMKKAKEDYFDKEFHLAFLADPENAKGYSIWTVTYKDLEDLKGKSDFMNKNLVNGFKQRLPTGANRHMFGVLNLFSDESEENWQITGAFIVRGLSVTSDLMGELYDVFNWTRIDSEAESTLSSNFYSTSDSIYCKSFIL